MKSYTDIEQSKKLAKILSIESADMFYRDNGIDVKLMWEHNAQKVTSPCWSLTALLSVIPNYKLSSEHNYHTCTADTSFGTETVGWFDCPVDACVAMIEKLHNLKMLKL